MQKPYNVWKDTAQDHQEIIQWISDKIDQEAVEPTLAIKLAKDEWMKRGKGEHSIKRVWKKSILPVICLRYPVYSAHNTENNMNEYAEMVDQSLAGKKTGEHLNEMMNDFEKEEEEEKEYNIDEENIPRQNNENIFRWENHNFDTPPMETPTKKVKIFESPQKEDFPFRKTYTSNTRFKSLELNIKGIDNFGILLHSCAPGEDDPTWKFSWDCKSMTITQKYKKKEPKLIMKAMEALNMIPDKMEQILLSALGENDWNEDIFIKTQVVFPFPVSIERMKFGKAGNTMIFLLYKKILEHQDIISNYLISDVNL